MGGTESRQCDGTHPPISLRGWLVKQKTGFVESYRSDGQRKYSFKPRYPTQCHTITTVARHPRKICKRVF